MNYEIPNKKEQAEDKCPNYNCYPKVNKKFLVILSTNILYSQLNCINIVKNLIIFLVIL